MLSRISESKVIFCDNFNIFPMKSRILLLLLVSFTLITFFSCKSDDEEDQPVNIKVRLTKEIINETDYGVDTYLYLYDEQNRLRKVAAGGYDEFTYNSDGTLLKLQNISGSWTESWNYYYKNGKIDYVVFKQVNNPLSYTDTTYYFYNSSGSINKSVKNAYDGGAITSFIIDYTYNNNNKLENRYENRYLNGQFIEYDSSAYTWSSAGNLTKIIKNRWSEYLINYTARYDYEYDTKNNYMKSVDFPDEILLIESLNPDEDISVNNCLLETRTYKDGSSSSSVYNYTEYNEQGYPLKMIADWGNLELEYEAY